MRLGLRTFGISLALHVAVLWALVHWRPPAASPAAPRRHTVAPIALVMPPRRPPVAAPVPVAPEPPVRRPSKPRKSPPAPAGTPVAPVQKPQPQDTAGDSAEQEAAQQVADAPSRQEAASQQAEEGLQGQGARQPGIARPGPRAPVDLFAGVDGVARGLPDDAEDREGGATGAGGAGDANAALQRATASLQALKHSLRGARAAAAVPRGVQAFGERLNRAFVPDPNSLQHASRLGTGAASLAQHTFNVKEREQHSVRAIAEQQMGPTKGGQTAAGSVSFGAGDGFNHDSATLRVQVVVHHDAQGKPQRWAIPRPSGDRQFDDAALASVRDAVDTLPAWADGVPRETHWEFELQALRWGRMEFLLDPGFTAPGREVDSGVLGKTMVVQAVKLVWLALAESTEAAPTPTAPE